ncbi:hypothetical protein [Roseovarius sp. D0-M9]|uniref:hypothetical protein n=1 Tax=Roseovarius sp. D0-M9 TaxID=3127117 RepID=UPI00300F8E90
MKPNVTETLLDSPYTSEAILAAIKLIDFSWTDWTSILNLNCCPFSLRRSTLQESASLQAAMLATCVYDNDSCDASVDLARRIEALHDIFKYAMFEVNDQFWARADGAVDIAEFQDSLGLVVSASNHQRIALEKQRQELIKRYDV